MPRARPGELQVLPVRNTAGAWRCIRVEHETSSSGCRKPAANALMDNGRFSAISCELSVWRLTTLISIIIRSSQRLRRRNRRTPRRGPAPLCPSPSGTRSDAGRLAMPGREDGLMPWMRLHALLTVCCLFAAVGAGTAGARSHSPRFGGAGAQSYSHASKSARRRRSRPARSPPSRRPTRSTSTAELRSWDG